jgi:hypothetical protein
MRAERFDNFESFLKTVDWDYLEKSGSALERQEMTCRIRNAYSEFHILSSVDALRTRRLWNSISPFKVCLHCGNVLFGNRPLICKHCGKENFVSKDSNYERDNTVSG